MENNVEDTQQNNEETYQATQEDINQVNSLVSVTQEFNSKGFIAGFLKVVKDGNVQPLAAYTVAKRMSKVGEELLKDEEFKRLANDEFDKYAGELKGAKSLNLYSSRILKTATYTYYDFKGCGHEVLDKLYEIQEAVKAHIAQIETEIKASFPKEPELKPLGQTSFGIPSTDEKVMFFEHMPTFGYENYGLQGSVKRPKKIQTIGLKYMKI